MEISDENLKHIAERLLEMSAELVSITNQLTRPSKVQDESVSEVETD